eukprot:6382641-Pyramimonas_sp.AAC.1
MRTQRLGPSVELPYGATKRMRDVPKLVLWAHANAAAGAVGGAPHGSPGMVVWCGGQERRSPGA